MILKYLIEKEFKLIQRNNFIKRIVIMMPVMVILLLPYAASYDIKDLNICITDNDNTLASRQLSHKILSGGYFRSVPMAPESYDIFLEIPRDFEKSLKSGTAVNLNISANAINGNKAGLGTGYLNEIIKDFIGMQGPDISIINRYNPQMNYRVFMIPALMVMLLTIVCGFLPALNIVGEKEDGTIEQMNVTPVGKFQFIFAKLVPYWIIGLIILTITMILAFFIHNLVPAGSIATMFIASALFIVAISGFGLLISNNSSTLSQAMFVMFFFILIFILLSGLYTPIESMPEWAQFITKLNPLTYFIKIMRAVYLRGATLADIAPLLGYISVFVVIFNLWAILSYRKRS